MGKQESAPGKQNLRVTCPMGEVEFKYFLSPVYCVYYMHSDIQTRFNKHPLPKKCNIQSAGDREFCLKYTVFQNSLSFTGHAALILMIMCISQV